MNANYVKVHVLDDEKLHIVTADNEAHVTELVTEFWFHDGELQINEITEIANHGVHITKHECK